MAIAYDNASVAYSGPVLIGCTVDYNAETLLLSFDLDLLSRDDDALMIKHANGVQVQTDVSFGGWFDVNIVGQGEQSNVVQVDLSEVLKQKQSEDDVTITGVRYAWSDMPCCPQAIELWPQRNYSYACEEAQCAIYAKKYDLPAIPFMYGANKKGQIGKCKIPVS